MNEAINQLTIELFIKNPIFWIIIILGFLLAIFYRIIIGKAGEFWVKRELSKLDKKIYHVINDVTIQDINSTHQIDHIVISQYGIFVIETKQYNGYISGNEYDKQWIQNKKYHIHNPIHQNYGHVKCLEKVLNLPNCEIFTVKDLTKMEMTVLKELNFKTLYTTSYDFMLFYLDIFKYFFNPSFIIIENIKKCAENIMKQNIMNNLFLNMSQSDYAYACLNQVFMQIGMNNIMNQIRNILMIFDINKLIKKNKSLDMNNTGDDNDIDNDDNLHHNLEMNLLNLPSF